MSQLEPFFAFAETRLDLQAARDIVEIRDSLAKARVLVDNEAHRPFPTLLSDRRLRRDLRGDPFSLGDRRVDDVFGRRNVEYLDAEFIEGLADRCRGCRWNFPCEYFVRPDDLARGLIHDRYGIA